MRIQGNIHFWVIRGVHTVSNLLEKTYLQHALRVVNTKEKNLLKLKVRDIPKYQKPTTNKKENRIGFGVNR